jgi:histidine triad (HIT) family protein
MFKMVLNKKCVFCELASDKEKTNWIYEDGNNLAFLDKNPINKGHILVIPKKHVPDFYKLDEKSYLSMMKVVRKLSNVVNEIFDPKKVGLIVAGFDVPHSHVHIIPMNEYNDITSKKLLDNEMPKFSNKEMLLIAKKIRGKLNE